MTELEHQLLCEDFAKRLGQLCAEFSAGGMNNFSMRAALENRRVRLAEQQAAERERRRAARQKELHGFRR